MTWDYEDLKENKKYIYHVILSLNNDSDVAQRH